MRTTRGEVEWHIAGLERELRDGMKRFIRAGVRAEDPDAASKHAALYRRAFARYVADLRGELDSPTPDACRVAVLALQVAYTARPWPMLQAERLQRRGPARLKDVNTKKSATAATARERCLAIKVTMRRPTPAAIRDEFEKRWPGKIPALRTIRRYLSTPQKTTPRK